MDKLQHLPDKPGVYLFRDAAGEIIYVGKAVSLKNRVRSYYQPASRLSPKVRAMMNRAVDFEYIVTDNEVEALILESNLIKEHRPRYNIYLKDDKSYPYLKVTLGEDFPRVHVTRRVVRDGSRYFGPYTSAGAVHETLDLLRRIFPFRTCKQKLAAGKLPAGRRPCLNYYIGRCLAPCSGQVGREEYRSIINRVCLFLEGRQDDLVKELTRRMNEAAEKLEFERAARFRDQLMAVRQVLENQKVLSTGREDRDVVALAQTEDLSLVMIFFVRGGKLIGRDQFLVPGAGNAPEEVLTAFVKQYYSRADFIPGEVLLAGIEPQERPAIEEWLSSLRGSRVRLVVPRRGEKKQLVELVAKNAHLALQEVEQERESRGQGEDACAELARELGLEKVPRRIECYDISNTQGEESVASMVVFEEGRPATDQYRRFKIRTVTGPNDYASLKEVLARRFNRAREEQELIRTGQLSTRQAGFHRLPDLLIVDGGRGQLSAAREVMKELGFGCIPAFGLAKEEELLFAEGRTEPIRLPRDSRALHLLQHLRDEAHRFALNYHRQLRNRRSLKSLLDEIEGIGPVRRRALLRAFPSLEDMARATVEELAAVPGMNRSAARAVYRFFHG
ncbi:Excinuclease ABC subunit C [Desulfofundulus australicus DSM 11792]|uniref:UvrABC system protein C n=1 Tax=Desulfofundulus australicus DSM 11792 TaxID=1121425 RepID=A0A1M4SAH2_9FIRM|nr:excinuclease ABC subunit UvrC [Desulfofundulus australicus]SHE29179.1 Excinuclease ABC subunit C [Desulfofundulus australicus DSM 11792]